jgi:hypothetical protein
MKRKPPTDIPPTDDAEQLREGDVAFSIDGFARASSLGRSSIYQAISDGKLRTVTVGRRRLILRGDGEAFLRGEV